MEQNNLNQTSLPALRAKTIPEIRLAAWVAVFAMAVLIAAGVKALVMKTTVVTNRETRIVTSDSVIQLQKHCAALEAKCEGLQTRLDDRDRILATQTQPLQQLTDSMLALQRSGMEVTAAIAERQAENARIRDQNEEKRSGRFNQLMDHLERLPDRSDLNTLFAQLPRPAVVTAPGVTLPKPATGKRWELHLEPFVETGLNQQLQPSLRGGARMWLRKSPRP
ncbi:MAG: hypothetical protein EOP52_13415 [Sphingobacteriales bacterium]|nr:MAG: hypothetical protein EOP52_13415 [Sphingobacteriales bacterium]